MIAAASAALLVIGSPAVATIPGVEPNVVTESVIPGGSFEVDKTVHTPPIPANPDVVLLVDNTGSMGPAIDDVKSGLHTIVSTVTAAEPTAQFAVATYKDVSDGAEAFNVSQQLTGVEADVQTAVDAMSASGGGDTPEDWFNALTQVATGAVTFRPDTSRVVVLVGDATTHDPSNGATQASTIAALNAANIKVVAVAVETGNDDGGLDGLGQATAVVGGTGGVLLGADPAAVAEAILSGISTINITVTPHVISCDEGLSVVIEPADATVPSGEDAHFKETFTVSADAKPGYNLHCVIEYLLNGTSGGDAFVQHVTAMVVASLTDTVAPTLTAKNRTSAKTFLFKAVDNRDKTPQIWVKDTGAGKAVFGPYASNVVLKFVKGAATAKAAKTSSGTYVISLQGNAKVYAVDKAKNQSKTITK